MGGPALAALAVVLAVAGLLGDLFESMLKRQAQVKDASKMLPGHGGMLDRLDSILFSAPLLAYARLFFIGR
jgi:phosphatidate cytidylyltransferase